MFGDHFWMTVTNKRAQHLCVWSSDIYYMWALHKPMKLSDLPPFIYPPTGRRSGPIRVFEIRTQIFYSIAHLSSFSFTFLIFLCVKEPRVGGLGLLITPTRQHVCYIQKMPWTEGLHSASCYWGKIPAWTIILMKQIIIIMVITYTEQQQPWNNRIKAHRREQRWVNEAGIY